MQESSTHNRLVPCWGCRNRTWPCQKLPNQCHCEQPWRTPSPCMFLKTRLWHRDQMPSVLQAPEWTSETWKCYWTTDLCMQQSSMSAPSNILNIDFSSAQIEDLEMLNWEIVKAKDAGVVICDTGRGLQIAVDARVRRAGRSNMVMERGVKGRREHAWGQVEGGDAGANWRRRCGAYLATTTVRHDGAWQFPWTQYVLDATDELVAHATIYIWFGDGMKWNRRYTISVTTLNSCNKEVTWLAAIHELWSINGYVSRCGVHWLV
jgi:hypothetical protein